METILIILVFVLLAIIVAGFFVFYQKLTKLGDAKGDDKTSLLLFERIKELNQTMDSSLKGLNQTVDNKLAQSTQQMQTQFAQSVSIIKGITEKIVELQQTNKQVMDFSAQLKNLEKVLTSQKQRGNLGEAALNLVWKIFCHQPLLNCSMALMMAIL
jgi:septal ring factor EnvC (AmiA/AmiB activator)